MPLRPRSRPLWLFFFLIAFSLAGADLPDAPAWRVRESRLLTETRLTEPGSGFVPLATATPEGYCVAWHDTRQGGSVMAARLDPAGRVLDPAGVPIAASSAYPAAVVASSSGCVVMYTTSNQIKGVLIPDEPGAPPVPHFTRPNPGYVLWRGDGRVVFHEYRPDAKRGLLLMSAEGETLARSDILDQPWAVAAWGDGFAVLTAKYLEDAAWEMAILRAGGDLQTETLASWTSDYLSEARIAAGDGEIVVVSGTPWNDPADFEVRRFDENGEQQSVLQLELPVGSSLRDLRFSDGVYHAEWSIHTNMLVVLTDGATVLESYQVANTLQRTFASRGNTGLHVWLRYGGGLFYEVAAGEPAGTGEPLTMVPASELLLDAADDDESVALLWSEYDRLGGVDRILLAASPKTAPSLEAPLLVRERPVEHSYSAPGAVAIRDGVVLVAWADGAGMWYRRATGTGSWLDAAPVSLRPAAAGSFMTFGRQGVTVGGEGFVVVWSEVGPDEITLRSAIIASDGSVRHFSLRNEPGEEHPLTPAVVATPGGYVVGWHHLLSDCRLSVCPPPMFPIRIGAYDPSFAFVENLTPEPLFSSMRPRLAAGSNEMLAFLGHAAVVFSAAPGGGWDEGRTVSLRPHTNLPQEAGLLWTGSAFLAAFSRIEGALVTTFGARIAPESASAALFPLVPDFSAPIGSSFPAVFSPWVPQLVRRGDELLLFGSETSTNPSDGMVRRLRMHVLEPFAARARAVRRTE